MQSGEMGIGELADAAGLSRRAVRFYVQQELIPAPLGRGRGRHYDSGHLERLRRIGELQAGGQSLDAIRLILDGKTAALPPPERRSRANRPAMSAELWTRLRPLEGVELSFDASRFNPTVEQLLALRDVIRDVFG